MLRFMKNKILIPLSIVAALAAFFSFKYIGDDGVDQQHNEMIQQVVATALSQAHYSPRPIDDSLSARVYREMLNSLDHEKKFFTQQDIKELEQYEYKIDDEIQSNKIEFYNKVEQIFRKRIDEAEKYYKELLDQPFDFTLNEDITLSGDSVDYPTDNKAMKERWRKYLKYRTLAKYVDLKEGQEQRVKDKDTSLKIVKTNKELEKEARESIGKNQEYLFGRLHKFDEEHLFTLYVNSIAGSFDPHTDYFPPEDKKKFDEQMSGSFFGIGARLGVEDGNVKVVEIIPGSPCWKQGDLKAEDIIIKVAQGDAEPVDVQGYDIEDVVSIIRGKKGTEVRLTVKKVTGAIQVIPIIRGEVLLDDVFAKSAVINTEVGPIGYIYLPSFYSDFQHINGRRCAEDVKIEIMKLKKVGVEGIILDLRYNGGGSLSDVVEMAGAFIDEGPVVQVKSSAAPARTLSDRQSGSLYDGPLAIMVNHSSASASEILAAAMQDYDRAIIVGSKTFGKGTVQSIISLDENLPLKDRIAARAKNSMLAEQPIGSLKLTIQKFYRINGGSTQLKGVTPDIVFPDAYQYIEWGERRNDAALPWDEIAAVPYEKSNSVNVQKIAALSNERIKNNPNFNLLLKTAEKMKEQEKDRTYPLNEVAYNAKLEEANKEVEKMEELEKDNTKLDIVNIKEDLQKINIDSSLIAKNKSWIESLEKDIYLTETVNIIKDMHKQSMNVNMGTGMKME